MNFIDFTIKPILTLKQELISKIEAALDTIRPYLEQDGGNVRIVGLSDEMSVSVEFLGACGSCPMSTMTFKAGIEEAIKRLVPEIVKVEAINLH